MRRLTLTLTCDRCGRDDAVVADNATYAREVLRAAGWRQGAIRDVCPECLGRRP